jgi:4,5-DOPA dioxygenase extradiol
MSTDLKPAIFIGHGSPMNILADNTFTRDMIKLGESLPEPEAIVVISAHWLTRGTYITSGSKPQQIYDFYGFPKTLYDFRYNSPGSPSTAELASEIVGQNIIIQDFNRGIDHAAWAILKHIFPLQNFPVLELSLDITKDPQYHFELGKKLSFLREKNILLIGSGNIIHNLGDIDFNEEAPPFVWAAEFDLEIKRCIETRDFSRLIDYPEIGMNSKRAIPYFDHYLPMLYILGMAGENEEISFIHESIQNGSISMRSFLIQEG